MSSIFCCIDSKPIPENRADRKGYAAVTCSDECYEIFRNHKKKPSKGQRVSEAEFALVMRIRRAKARGDTVITLHL
jgi:predicted nucleic acid-binding Zn ribbon protein